MTRKHGNPPHPPRYNPPPSNATLEESELLASHARGRWGFSVPLAQALGQSMLTVDVPSWMARCWTINVKRMRYGSTAPGTPSGLPVPPDTNHGGPDTQVMTDASISLQWGIDGAQETATLDYPVQGATFQLHAAFIRMYINSPTTTVSPIVGAFVSPSNRGGSGQDLYPCAAVRTFNLTVGPNSVQRLDIPERAVAYRLLRNDTNLQSAIESVQCINGGSVLSFDYAAISSGSGEPLQVTDGTNGHYFTTRELWMPLDSQAAFLKVTNPQAVVIATFRVQFLLDLG